MEKAKLIIRKTKRKKLEVKLHFTESNKEMPFPQLKVKDTSMNNMEVEVERIEGKVVKVQAGEKLLYLVPGAKAAERPGTSKPVRTGPPKAGKPAKKYKKSPS